MKAKRVNLQPWIEYFKMLRVNEEKGFLQMEPDRHEAYITLPCLCALSTGVDVERLTPEAAERMKRQFRKRIPRTVRWLRDYSVWLAASQSGGQAPGPDDHGEPVPRPGASPHDCDWFAVHVVHDSVPHDLLYTILLTRRRRWWSLRFKTDGFEVVEYHPVLDGKKP